MSDMSAIPALPPEARDTVVKMALAQLERDGFLSNSDVALKAQLCGCSPRTFRRWVHNRAVMCGHRDGFHINDFHHALYAKWAGNVAAVHREMLELGLPAPSLRTLQRAFDDELTPSEHAMAKDGVVARRACETNLRVTYEARNELWITDHSELNVLVLPARGNRPVRPYSTIFIDAKTKAITGWALSLQPNAAVVLGGLRRAVLPNDDGTPFCGRPDMLQSDNGTEFTAGAVRDAMGLLGGQFRQVKEYSPHLNGIVERLHRTMDQTWLSGEAFSTDIARDHAGRHMSPDGLPPLFNDFAGTFGTWAYGYNCEQLHAGADGGTCLDAWNADATPLLVPDEEDLDYLLLAGVKRKVGAYGVLFNNEWYNAGALAGRRKQAVIVRAPLHDPSYIDVYRGGELLCRATLSDSWTADERKEFINCRSRGRKRGAKARRDAMAMQAVVLDQSRAPVEKPAELARRDKQTRTDGALKRSSANNLLPINQEAA